MKAPSQTQCAYVAGFVDADGCITVGKSKHEGSSRYPNPTYSAVVHIGNRNLAVLRKIQALFGGSIRKSKKLCNTTVGFFPDLNRYQLYGAKARGMLRAILPYLVVKREEAELVLSLNQKQWGWRKLSQAEVDEREQVYQRIKAIHQSRKSNIFISKDHAK